MPEQQNGLGRGDGGRRTWLSTAYISMLDRAEQHIALAMVGSRAMERRESRLMAIGLIATKLG